MGVRIMCVMYGFVIEGVCDGVCVSVYACATLSTSSVPNYKHRSTSDKNANAEINITISMSPLHMPYHLVTRNRPKQ